jgi:hypothetical protein
MSRIRTIKPSFFLDDELAELSPLTRLLFIGLWTLADCEGRLEDRPKRIRAQVLPFDDGDTDAMLQSLHDAGFIRRYVVAERRYLLVTNFKRHQRLSGVESQSTSDIPGPESIEKQPRSDEEANEQQTRSDEEANEQQTRSDEEADNVQEGKGKEGKGKEEGVMQSEEGIPREADDIAAASPPSQRSETAASRLPKNWTLPKSWGEWALKDRPDWDGECVKGVSIQFRDHWLARAGPTALKADWQAAWRSWVRRERDPPVRINGRKPNAQEALEMANRAATSGWKPPELREQVG